MRKMQLKNSTSLANLFKELDLKTCPLANTELFSNIRYYISSDIIKESYPVISRLIEYSARTLNGYVIVPTPQEFIDILEDHLMDYCEQIYGFYDEYHRLQKSLGRVYSNLQYAIGSKKMVELHSLNILFTFLVMVLGIRSELLTKGQ